MALYLLMLLTVAAITGLIYEKRAFCSYICPVGHLLGLYAMIAPWQWRADDVSICKGCKTKDCIAKKNHYRLAGRSCTSNLYPATIKDNRDCLLCTQCFKACPYGNLQLSARRPFADFFRGVELRPAQIGFVLLVSGFVVYEILSEWPVSKGVLTWLPRHLADALGLTGPSAALVSAVVMFIVLPACLFSAVIALAKIRSKISPKVIAGELALLLVPTMAAAHIIKAILKMTSRIGYWPHALSDPAGLETARKILDKQIPVNLSAFSALDGMISLVSAALLVIALGAALSILHKSAQANKFDATIKVPLFLGVFIYWGIFAFTIFKWRF
jgi:NAD-dependent dihydropyrimidine dehydrogenase PreA subunit